MVRAILAGQKTQTRRVLSFQPDVDELFYGPEFYSPTGYDRFGDERPDPDVFGIYDELGEWGLKCPYGAPGTVLWVRETWGSLNADHPRCKNGRKPQKGDRLVYRANLADDYQWGVGKPSQGDFCWRPSIHMPRWACRLLLEVTSVRVERLQDITPMACIAEGVRIPVSREAGGQLLNHTGNFPPCDYISNETATAFRGPTGANVTDDLLRAYFASLWDGLNHNRGHGWDSNPWVWVIEFERVKRG